MSYERYDDGYWEGWNGEICSGCDLPSRVNDLGLCRDCYAKLVRDLIRSRDWDYSGKAFTTPDEELENLRLKIIREYGAAYELITPPTKAELMAHKSVRPTTLPLNQNLPDIPPRQAGNYTEQDVVEVLEQILASTSHYEWRELQEVADILRRYFPDLNPKAFGYKGLRRLVQAHPKQFQTQWDDPNKKRNRQLYIRLTKDHTKKSSG
jgi:Fe-S-cluster formation regulator IscX/YfhJ